MVDEKTDTPSVIPPVKAVISRHPIRRLYDWVLSWAESRHGTRALAGLAFAESSFFPIPPDVLLIALALGKPSKALRFALVCSVASVIGGMFGYFLGMVAWDTVGVWIVEHIAHVPVVDGKYIVAHVFGREVNVNEAYDQYNAWIVFAFGLTPLPYKLVTLSAGFCRINFPIFLLASVCSRSLRFFAVAIIIKIFGPKAKDIIDRYFNWLCIAFTILLIGGFMLVAFVFKH